MASKDSATSGKVVFKSVPMPSSSLRTQELLRCDQLKYTTHAHTHVFWDVCMLTRQHSVNRLGNSFSSKTLRGRKGQSADCAAFNKLHVATRFLYLSSFLSNSPSNKEGIIQGNQPSESDILYRSSQRLHTAPGPQTDSQLHRNISTHKITLLNILFLLFLCYSGYDCQENTMPSL